VSRAPAAHPAVVQSRRPACVGLGVHGVVVELVDDLAAVVEMVALVDALRHETAGVAGFERVERAVDDGLAHRAVAQLRIVQVDRSPRTESVIVGKTDARFAPVDRALVSYPDGAAGAQDVELLQRDTGAVGTAAAPEIEAGVQRPDIARRHEYIDLAVVI